jgi:hypothetical protein
MASQPMPLVAWHGIAWPGVAVASASVDGIGLCLHRKGGGDEVMAPSMVEAAEAHQKRGSTMGQQWWPQWWHFWRCWWAPVEGGGGDWLLQHRGVDREWDATEKRTENQGRWSLLKGGNGGSIAGKSGGVSDAPISHHGREVESASRPLVDFGVWMTKQLKS